MEVTINTKISVGDAGTPFPISIEVSYEKEGNVITVIDWMENESPYDNPPELWFAQVKEAIDDFFFDQDNSSTVVVFQEGKPQCPCGVPSDIHSTTMCGWDAALMRSNEQGIITDRRHPGFGKPFMSWKNAPVNITISQSV
jgi:hypothetical protein